MKGLNEAYIFKMQLLPCRIPCRGTHVLQDRCDSLHLRQFTCDGFIAEFGPLTILNWEIY